MATATPTYTIREATQEDVPEILAMIEELAAHTGNGAKVTATAAQLQATLRFADSAAAAAGAGWARTFLIFPIVPDSTTGGKILPTHRKGIPRPPMAPAPAGDARAIARPAGMALFFPTYSTWRASPGVHCEDLFVRAAYRGRGFGRALLAALARETRAIGGQRLEWGVQADNAASIAFYESPRVGARRLPDWFDYRVDGPALDALAADDGTSPKAS